MAFLTDYFLRQHHPRSNQAVGRAFVDDMPYDALRIAIACLAVVVVTLAAGFFGKEEPLSQIFDDFVKV